MVACLGRQVDGLGVAAALEVEDAAIRPAVFVIADQRAVGACRKGGLAGAGKPEEHRGINRVSDGVVGAAMHGHHALGGQQIVQDGEDRFLVLAGIGGVADQHGLLVEIQRDHGFRAAAVTGRVGLERRAVDDRPFRGEAVQFCARRAAQQVADEKPVPGQFGDHSHIQAVHRVGPGVKVLHKKIAAPYMRQHVGLQPGKGLGRHGRIVFPPDRVLHRRRAHHELVFRAAAGELSGRAKEGTTLAQTAFAARHSLFN